MHRRNFIQATAVALAVSPTELLAKGGTYIDAADYGFLPTESGVNNQAALQKAVDQGGSISVNVPGTYKIAGTVYLGDNTALNFGAGVIIQKVAENGSFVHVFLNKGALTWKWNSNISITGLHLQVNGVEKGWDERIYGLRGQVAFFYAKDVKIERFRCLDLGNKQFCLHFCTFEDLLINDVIIKGKKDAIHFGKGKRFKISNSVFQTADDAIALAAGDWVTANPEFGDIEDGIIENCHDLRTDHWDGSFIKLVASAWVDWRKGIELRHGDAVVSNGKIYRVIAPVDGKQYLSVTPPAFTEGYQVLDGIRWLFHGNEAIYTAVVRNVVMRDLYIESDRSISLMCYSNNYSHSYYKGAPMPIQSNITLDNVNVMRSGRRPVMHISSPVDVLNIRNSTLKDNSIEFGHAKDFDRYPKTALNLSGCTFQSAEEFPLVRNHSLGKEVFLKTTGSIELGEKFAVRVEAGPGKIVVNSDLTGLK
jgi:hypothetical protein